MNWLKVGDNFFSFLHRYASIINQKNQFKCLKDEVGRVTNDEREMEVIV